MMTGHYKPWSAEMDARLSELWAANVIQAEIATALQRSKGSIYERAKFLKLPTRNLSKLNKNMRFWTPEKDSELRRLFAEGLAFSEIGRQIGAASRNACIGRAGRLGMKRGSAANLKNRSATTANAIRASAVAAAKRKAEGVVIPRPRLKVLGGNQVFEEAVERIPRETLRAMAWEPLVGSSPRHFTDPGFSRLLHCSWPVGAGVETRCAEPIKRGAYCGCHAAIAYTQPKPRNSAKELVRSLRRYA